MLAEQATSLSYAPQAPGLLSKFVSSKNSGVPRNRLFSSSVGFVLIGNLSPSTDASALRISEGANALGTDPRALTPLRGSFWGPSCFAETSLTAAIANAVTPPSECPKMTMPPCLNVNRIGYGGNPLPLTSTPLFDAIPTYLDLIAEAYSSYAIDVENIVAPLVKVGRKAAGVSPKQGRG
jgi:hypothetical protein